MLELSENRRTEYPLMITNENIQSQSVHTVLVQIYSNYHISQNLQINSAKIQSIVTLQSSRAYPLG